MNAEESVPEVGTWARDLTRDKIGCVIGHVGSHVQLRPLGGGQDWDAAPADLEPVPASELLRPRVAEECAQPQGLPMSAPVPRRAEAASSAGAMVPALASAATGRAQTAYRAFLNHPQDCPDCAAQSGRCDAAQQLWDTYRQERG